MLLNSLNQSLHQLLTQLRMFQLQLLMKVEKQLILLLLKMLQLYNLMKRKVKLNLTKHQLSLQSTLMLKFQQSL